MSARKVAPARHGGPDPKPDRRKLGLGKWARQQSVVATTRLMTYGVYGLLAVVSLMAFMAFVRPAPKAPVVRIPAPTTGPEGVAEVYVAAWLGAPQSDLSSIAVYYPAPASFGDSAPVAGLSSVPPVRVLRTATVDARPISDNYWAVTVAATVQGDTAATVRFFRVGVMRTPAKVYVATSLPSEVAAPLGSRAPSLAAGGYDSPGPEDPVAGAVSRFLGALLAGDGELSRYVAPGATVRAVKPAPFVGVQITGMAQRRMAETPGHIEVDVNAVGKDQAGRFSAFSYPLELAQRAGRWEVAAVLVAPSLAGAQPDLTPLAPAVVAPTLPSQSTPSTYPPAGPTTSVSPTTTAAPAATTTTRRF